MNLSHIKIIAQMFMRYYPRQVKPIKRMEVPYPDKGRKHYWGYDKGDYGMYTSEDQAYIRQMNETYRYHRHKRSLTVDAAMALKNAEEVNQEVFNPETSKKKNVVKFADVEEIRLPSISRVSRQTQTSEQEKLKQRQIESSEKKRVKTERDAALERRYRTEQSELRQFFSRNEISFEPGTRFSPTFVCSVLNPLPSYIIQPHLYRSPQYTHAQKSQPRGQLSTRKY